MIPSPLIICISTVVSATALVCCYTISGVTETQASRSYETLRYIVFVCFKRKRATGTTGRKSGTNNEGALLPHTVICEGHP
ncbi:hypothetical protein F4824DRAFT_480886 [Ustulina deusta]|nr:hypothetical protein F4824DRAFT_480886 [Ustulina deusta]